MGKLKQFFLNKNFLIMNDGFGEASENDGSPSRNSQTSSMQQYNKPSFIDLEYYINNDNFDAGYEQATEAVVCVKSFMEHLLTQTINKVIDRKINKQIPGAILDVSRSMFDSALTQLSVHIEDESKFFHEAYIKTTNERGPTSVHVPKEDNCSLEPGSIDIDTWARRRVTKHDKLADSNDKRPI